MDEQTFRVAVAPVSRMRVPSLVAMAAINACFMSTVFIFLLFGNLMGGAYATGSQISTLPATAYVLSAAVSIIPISALMARKGRMTGFSLGAAAGMMAGSLTIAAAAYSSYSLLTCAGVCVGILTAASVFIRFAAIELYEPRKHGMAASVVLSGGIAAAIFANYLPTEFGDLLGVPVFKGAGFAMLALGTVAFAVCAVTPTKHLMAQRDATTQPAGFLSKVRRLIGHTSFLRAALLSALGYAVMVLIMNSTPHLLTVICRYPLPTAEAVMSYHYLAMFLPFLFSGLVLDRLGCSAMILVGIAAYAITVGLLVTAYSETRAAFALVGLGLGWNFIFIGATAALVDSVPKALAHASQTLSEVTTDVFNVMAAVAAGYFIRLGDFTLTLALASILITVALAVWALPSRDYVMKDIAR